MEELYSMVDQLMHGEIDGFLLDKYSFWAMSGVIQVNSKGDHYHGDLRNFLLTETIATDVPYSGNTQPYSYHGVHLVHLLGFLVIQPCSDFC